MAFGYDNNDRSKLFFFQIVAHEYAASNSIFNK